MLPAARRARSASSAFASAWSPNPVPASCRRLACSASRGAAPRT